MTVRVTEMYSMCTELYDISLGCMHTWNLLWSVLCLRLDRVRESTSVSAAILNLQGDYPTSREL